MTYCEMLATSREKEGATYRNEEIRHLLLVLLPSISVLASTTLDISHGTMNNHNHEEHRVKPWERAPA
jgi:hypothetical protein